MYKHCPRCALALVPCDHSGRERLLCEGCGFVHYDNPLPVVAGIVETAAGVVLVRSHGWPEKMFGLVTGFLERGETPEEAVVREVREEVGLEAKVLSLVGVYPFVERNEVIVAYALFADGEVRLGEEIAESRVVPKAKLRPWPFGTGLAVADWLARSPLAGE
jgi:NADH pyrophosphatase NudC (nudix superfamily)